MIRALAIETSGRSGSIALAVDGEVVGESEFPHGLQNAARIVPAIDEVCRSVGWKARQIEEIYVSAGPGSFTGLRIGITLAKTLAFVTGAKLVAVPSARVLGENAPAEAKHAIIVLDAKREQIFTASFDRAEEGWKMVAPARLSTLIGALATAPRPVYLLGEGIPFHEKFIPRDDAGVIVADAGLWRARASAAAKIGRQMARAGEFVEAERLTPIYIRMAEAEEKFEAAKAAADAMKTTKS